MKPVWAVVKVIDPRGVVGGYEIEKTVAACAKQTAAADGSKRIVLKKFDTEAEAQKYQEKVLKARAASAEGAKTEEAPAAPCEEKSGS